MHEMSLAEGIRQIVEEAAEAEGCTRVRTVVLEIGELAVIEVESLRFCFDAVMENSLAAAAVLQIERVPGSGWCACCARRVPIATLYDPCPLCGDYRVQADGGMDMRVIELEIE